MREYRGDRARLYTHGERTRYTRHKLQLGKFPYKILVKFCHHWGTQTVEQVLRGGISIFGDTQNPAGQRPEQLDLV